MKHRVLLLTALIASALTAGCGGGDDDGTLSVSQVFEPARPFAIEGTAAEITVRGESGTDEHVLEAVGTGETQLLEQPAPAGTYDVTAAQRACNADACMHGVSTNLPVVISCSRSVEVTGGEMTDLIVRVRPTGHGSCVIEDA